MARWICVPVMPVLSKIVAYVKREGKVWRLREKHLCHIWNRFPGLTHALAYLVSNHVASLPTEKWVKCIGNAAFTWAWFISDCLALPA